MADEAEDGSDAGSLIEVADPLGVETTFVDFIITGGFHDDVLHITLGTRDYTYPEIEPGHHRIVVASKLRMSRAFAGRLHVALGKALEATQDEGTDAGLNPLNRMVN